MAFKIKIRDRRFYIPRAIRMQEKMDLNAFYNIKTRHGRFAASFIIYLGEKDERIRIPKKIGQDLRLKMADEVEVTRISKIVRSPTPKDFLNKNYIDLFYFIPKKTYSNLPVICREYTKMHKKFLECWYSSKGRPSELSLKRFVSTDFLELCGYYQAEGSKLKLRARQGRNFLFTNSSPRIISNVVRKLFDIGLEPEVISLYCRYDKSLAKRGAGPKIRRFCSNLGLNGARLKIRSASRIENFVSIVAVTNSLFGETIMNAMDYFRKRFAYKIKDSEKELCYKFLRGLFDGDGSIFVHRDKSLHIRIMLYEGRKEYVWDYANILQNLGICGKITKVKNKNPYILTVNGNWQVLSKFLKGHILSLNIKKQEMLLNAINQHERFRTMEPLFLFADGKSMATYELRQRTGWKYGWMHTWLRRRARERIITLIRKRKINGTLNNVWRLSKLGTEELNTLLTVKEGLKRLHKD